jgi:SAM-dependent methyltransferase
MRAGLALRWPPLPGSADEPQWIGQTFQVGARSQRVLAYGAEASGWTDHLTALHEEAIGPDHFIDIASRRHAIAETTRAHAHADQVILEVGVSSGYLLDELLRAMPYASIIGADYTYQTLEGVGARLPHVPLLQFDLVTCPLPDACIDTVILLNVLEHIERDEAAVRQLFRILKPGGVAIVEVPAGQHLYDSYDKALMHWRRYDMANLVGLFEHSGFRVEQRSHLGCVIYPAFWLAKKLRRAAPEDDRNLHANLVRTISWSARLGFLASAALSSEAALRKLVYLPFGARCLVTCRKPARPA